MLDAILGNMTAEYFELSQAAQTELLAHQGPSVTHMEPLLASKMRIDSQLRRLSELQLRLCNPVSMRIGSVQTVNVAQLQQVNGAGALDAGTTTRLEEG